MIDEIDISLIILAGYMRILSSDFINHFAGKILNIHPSLLPKFPGLNTHRKAIDAKEVEIAFEPNVGPQTDFLSSPEKEVLYGGAAGGGKSYAMLMDLLRYADNKNHRAFGSSKVG